MPILGGCLIVSALIASGINLANHFVGCFHVVVFRARHAQLHNQRVTGLTYAYGLPCSLTTGVSNACCAVEAPKPITISVGTWGSATLGLCCRNVGKRNIRRRLCCNRDDNSAFLFAADGNVVWPLGQKNLHAPFSRRDINHGARYVCSLFLPGDRENR